MTAKVMPPGGETTGRSRTLDHYDQQLMTAVVDRAEKAGKQVKPLIVPTNNPLHAMLKTAKDLQAQELVLGASNKFTADEQLDQIAFYWISLHDGQPGAVDGAHPEPRSRRLLRPGRRQSHPEDQRTQGRSVAELRAAGVGVDRVLLVHDGTPASSDLFQAVLTMLDPAVHLALVPLAPPGNEPQNGQAVIQQDVERARQLGRELTVLQLRALPAPWSFTRPGKASTT